MIRINTLLLFSLFLATLLSACRKSGKGEKAFADEQLVSQVEGFIAHGSGPDTFKRSIATMKSLLQEYPKDRDEGTYSFLMMSIGQFYGIHGVHDSAIHYIAQVLPYYETNTEPGISRNRYFRSLFVCYFVYGESLMTEGENITKANYYLSKAAYLCCSPEGDSLIDKRYKATALQYAITTNRYCKQYEQALTFGKKALQLIALAQPGTFQAHNFRILCEMANCYSESNQFDSSRVCIVLLEKDAIKLQHEMATRDLYNVKGTYYYYTKQYDSSLKYSLLSTKQGGDSDDLSALTSYSNNLGLCIRLKRWDEARKWYLLSEEKYHKIDSIDASDKIAYFENKIPYLFLQGDKNKAEQDYWELADMKEQEYGRERLKMFAAIESEYNLTAKEKKITALNTQNKIAKDRQKSLSLILLLSCLLTGAVTITALLLVRQRKLKQEKEKALLQQQLLRTQMEPHFIFNTLSALQSFVRFDEKEKTMKYLSQFSRLLRSSLELSRKNLVPLTEEIETLENYLSLQKMRYDNAFAYHIHCEEDIHGLMIPPMLIQPFVENAIVHGIDPNSNNGVITIEFVIKRDNILVTIKDNGKGVQASPVAQEHKSLATTISRERLAMMAKESGIAAGITINNGTVNGTVVTLTIPNHPEPEWDSSNNK